jgi:hypothetical protein
MTLKDDDLKRLYRSYVAGRAEPDRKACPSWKELSDFFGTKLGPKKKLKIIDHVTNCSACAEEFEFLYQLDQRGEDVAEEADRRSSRPQSGRVEASRFWRMCYIAVGGLLLLASLAIIIQKRIHQGEIRTAPSEVILTSPGRDRSGSIPLTFRWEKFKGAESYVLELFDETLLPVWKSPETEGLSLLLPEEVGKLLPANKRYFWMITAYGGGIKIAESSLAPFKLSPASR